MVSASYRMLGLQAVLALLVALLAVAAAGAAGDQASEERGLSDGASGSLDSMEFKGPVYSGQGSWARLKMDQAKADSSSSRAEFKTAGGDAANDRKLPKKVRKFCATAAGQCTGKSVQQPRVAATRSQTDGSTGASVSNGLGYARNRVLSALKSRLGQLESDLGQVRQSVVGRRLLTAESQALSFPKHFYKVFGGLNQVEAASFSVLHNVEQKICKVYNKFCLSVGSTLVESSEPKTSQTTSEQPIGSFDLAVTGARQSLPASSDVNFGNPQREYISPREFPLPERLDAVEQPERPVAEPPVRSEAANQRERHGRIDSQVEEDHYEWELQNARNRRRDERRERRLERRERREKRRERRLRDEARYSGPRSVDKSRTYVNVYVNQPTKQAAAVPAVDVGVSPLQQATVHQQKASATPTTETTVAHKSAPSSPKKPVKLDKPGLCGMAEPVCNRDGAHRNGKEHGFPAALYAKYGLKGGVESATFAERSEIDVKICRDAKCICDNKGCEAVKHKTTKMVGEDGEEEPEMTPAELEEWWLHYTENFNPGGAGSPGFHPGQDFPPKQPVQYEDGTWSIDPETGVGPKACIFMYAGIHCGGGVVEGANDALANATEAMAPIGSEQIKKFWSFHPTAVRNVLWDDDESNPIHKILYFVIPSLHDYPTLPHATKIDIREWTFSGRTTLFLGGVINIYVINEIFNVHLEPQYMPGPYEWNERYAVGTPFEDVPRKVFEQGNSRAGMTGVLVASIPIGGKTFFDTNGASVAMCFHHGMGRVCYVDQEFIRPMSDYGYMDWVSIVRAALNGGTCDDPCADGNTVEAKSTPACLAQQW